MSDLPAKLTEMDRLRLQLAKERQGRLQAEAANLSMAVGRNEAEVRAAQAEDKALFDGLKVSYQLEDQDEVKLDGTIKRSAVRALKEA